MTWRKWRSGWGRTSGQRKCQWKERKERRSAAVCGDQVVFRSPAGSLEFNWDAGQFEEPITCLLTECLPCARNTQQLLYPCDLIAIWWEAAIPIFNVGRGNTWGPRRISNWPNTTKLASWTSQPAVQVESHWPHAATKQVKCGSSRSGCAVSINTHPPGLKDVGEQDAQYLTHILHWLYVEDESESHLVVSNSLWSHGLHSPWNSPGHNTRVGSLSLLQGIFPTQGSNPGLSHCRWILYQLSHQGSPVICWNSTILDVL